MKVSDEYMPTTDIQFKHELRKQLTDLERKLELLENKDYDKLKREYLKEIEDIQASLQDQNDSNFWLWCKVFIEQSNSFYSTNLCEKREEITNQRKVLFAKRIACFE